MSQLVNSTHNDKGVSSAKIQLTPSSSLNERIASALLGSVVTMTFMTPLDVVKTRLQETPLNNKPYKGTMDGLTNIIKHEGAFALWRGLMPGLAMSIPSTSIYFVGYDHIRDYTKSRFANTLIDTYSPLWAGALARSIASFVVSPIELFRTRMQSANTHGFKDVWTGVTDMVRVEGISSLWRGLLPTMLRDVPFSAVYWMGYEGIRDRLESDKERSSFQISFIAGATSGTVAAILTTPFDVIKTQRQISSNTDETRLGKVLKNIMVKEGFTGFFRGLVPRILRVAPACAIMISSYEMGKRFFGGRNLANQQQ